MEKCNLEENLRIFQQDKKSALWGAITCGVIAGAALIGAVMSAKQYGINLVGETLAKEFVENRDDNT